MTTAARVLPGTMEEAMPEATGAEVETAAAIGAGVAIGAEAAEVVTGAEVETAAAIGNREG
jgi:hypothetical protein